MRKELWLMVLALALLAGLLAPDALAEGRRLVVQMEEPFEVSGQLFAGGELSLCEVRAFSPVATLHEVRINGQSLGILMAQDDGRPLVAQRDEVIFERSRDGHLVLTSVALTGEPVRLLFDIGNNPPKVQPRSQLLARAR